MLGIIRPKSSRIFHPDACPSSARTGSMGVQVTSDKAKTMDLRRVAAMFLLMGVLVIHPNAFAKVAVMLFVCALIHCVP
jgi:hypothetical protein